MSLVCRSNYEAVKEHGVALRTHSFGDFHFAPHAVFSSVDDAADHASEATQQAVWDYVVVATKALRMDKGAAELIRPLLSPKTAIVLVQNGFGVEEPYKQAFPGQMLISAISLVSAAQIEKAVIQQYRWTRLNMGPYTDARGSVSDADREIVDRTLAAARELAAIFARNGIDDAKVHDACELQMIRWHKVCINASMNTSGVLSGCLGNADMLKNPELRTHILGAMYEVIDAAPKIFGKPLPESFATPEKIVSSNERNASATSSMVQDWKAGNKLELEAILGNPIRTAGTHGIAMPRLQAMYALLGSAEAHRSASDKPN